MNHCPLEELFPHVCHLWRQGNVGNSILVGTVGRRFATRFPIVETVNIRKHQI